jgi:hypothetical protein
MLKDLLKHKDRILEKREAILPKTKWYEEPSRKVAQPPSLPLGPNKRN